MCLLSLLSFICAANINHSHHWRSKRGLGFGLSSYGSYTESENHSEHHSSSSSSSRSYSYGSSFGLGGVSFGTSGGNRVGRSPRAYVIPVQYWARRRPRPAVLEALNRQISPWDGLKQQHDKLNMD